MRDGLVPIADFLNIQQVGDEPFMGVEGIPFLSGSLDELKVLHKYIRPEFEKIAAGTTRRSSTSCRGRSSICISRSRSPMSTALKGIKIRVPDKNAQDIWPWSAWRR